MGLMRRPDRVALRSDQVGRDGQSGVDGVARQFLEVEMAGRRMAPRARRVDERIFCEGEILVGRRACAWYIDIYMYISTYIPRPSLLPTSDRSESGVLHAIIVCVIAQQIHEPGRKYIDRLAQHIFCIIICGNVEVDER